VASQRQGRREAGSWWFIAGNVLWIVWAWHVDASAVIALQPGSFVLNVRGAMKNDVKNE